VPSSAAAPKKDWANYTPDWASQATKTGPVAGAQRIAPGTDLLNPVNTPGQSAINNQAIIDRMGRSTDEAIAKSRASQQEAQAIKDSGPNLDMLHARLDRMNTAVGQKATGAGDKAKATMNGPLPNHQETVAPVRQHRTSSQLEDLYRNNGYQSGNWSNQANGAMVDEAGSSTAAGRQSWWNNAMRKRPNPRFVNPDDEPLTPANLDLQPQAPSSVVSR